MSAGSPGRRGLAGAPLRSESPRTLALVAVVIAFYYGIVGLFSRNFPISDDFWLLDFVNRFASGALAGDLPRQLFEQHNEHRIAVARLLYLLDYRLFGELDFRRLIVVGNLFPLGLFLILRLYLPRLPDGRSLLLFAACLVFQFSAAESIFWSMAAISNQLVPLLAVATFALLVEGGALNVALAIGCCVLAALTQGNGLFVPFIAMACLVLQRRGYAAVSMACAALLIDGFYFYDYHPVHPAASAASSTIAWAWQRLVFALSFTGSAFGIGGSHYPVLTRVSLVPTVALGVFVWGVTLYCLRSRWRQGGTVRSDLFLWLNVFVMATAASAALARADFGLAQSMLSRYHGYSVLAIIATVALLVEHGAGPWRRIVDRSAGWLSPLAAAYLVASMTFVAFFCYGIYAPVRSHGIIFDDVERGRAILERAHETGVFDAH